MATSQWRRSPGNRGTRRILVGNAKAKQKKHKRRIAGKKIVYRDKTHCGMDTIEGTLLVRTVVKWFSVLAKGGKATRTLR